MASPDDDDLPIAKPAAKPAPPPDAGTQVPPPAPRGDLEIGLGEAVTPEPDEIDRAFATPGTPTEPRPNPFPESRPRERGTSHPLAVNDTRSVIGEPPPSRTIAACGVIGCLGGAALAGVGVLAYIAITLLTHFSEQQGDTKSTQPQTESGRPTRAPRPGPVGPTRLPAGATTAAVTLTGMVDAVGTGANGRYLLLRIPSRREIAVFDPTEAKVIGNLGVGEPNVLFAAGAAKLFVYKPKAQMLQRWSLLNWSVEQEVHLPGPRPDALVIGPGADGPLFVITAQGDSSDIAVFDTDSLARDAMHLASHKVIGWKIGIRRAIPRPSADGLTIGVGAGDPNPPREGLLLRFDANGGMSPVRITEPGLAGHLDPSPDGRFVYTTRGVFDREGRPVVKPSPTRPFYTFPTAQGSDLYLSLTPQGNTTVAGPVLLYPAGTREAGADLGLDLDLGDRKWGADDPPGTVPAYQRIHVWPGAGLAAVLAGENNRLDLYRLDLPDLLKRSQQTAVVFASEPPAAHPGGSWVYAPTVWSVANGKTVPVRLRLEQGPEGMTVDALGRVRWHVPTTAIGDEEIVIRADTPDGRSGLQRFRLVMIEPPG